MVIITTKFKKSTPLFFSQTLFCLPRPNKILLGATMSKVPLESGNCHFLVAVDLTSYLLANCRFSIWNAYTVYCEGEIEIGLNEWRRRLYQSTRH